MRAIVLVLALFASVSQAIEDYETGLYSEHAYLGREDVLSSLIRLRAEKAIFPYLHPYVQLGSELETIGQGQTGVDFSSYAYVAFGARFVWSNIQFFSEVRFRKYYRDISPDVFQQPAVDGRFLVVYGNFWSTPLASATPFSYFNELYTETLFTTADLYNVVNDTFLRSGLRWTLARSTFMDLFLEPYITLDRVGHFYNNRADLKASVRFQQWIGPISISLFVSYLGNAYFPYAQYEPNPYTDRNFGFRGLLVVGGSL